MKKFLSFFLIIFCACIFAGIYGILHDQLTYTISPEYYTKFKFFQFGFQHKGVEAILPNPRLTVSSVGFLATWWMGIPIGATLAALSLIYADWKSMLRGASIAFLITTIVAFATGLYGLAYGYAVLIHQPKESFTRWFIPDNIIDFENFIAVGSMHNFSYVGGLLGMIAGGAYIIRSGTKKRGERVFKILWTKK